MWADVERDLALILSTRLFPVLSTDPGYCVMLRNAGLFSIPEGAGGRVDPGFAQAQSAWRNSTPMKSSLHLHSSTQNLPPATQDRLRSAAQLCCQLLLMDIETQNSLRERRAKAAVLEGSTTVYRIWDSRKNNRTGHWWFSDHLLNVASRESKAANQSTQDWLRNRLAISYDFSQCDRISKLILGPSAAVPCVEAWGLPMAHQSTVNVGPTFQGEKTQYFLPFIPPDRICDVSWP
jgi:hypothetical protein